MTIFLLDSNAMIAQSDQDHAHKKRVRTWLNRIKEFAVCPITEGAMVRYLFTKGIPAADIYTALTKLTERSGYHFWPDSISYSKVKLDKLLGHKQVTDAYLAQLARANKGKLATIDGGLVELHPDVAILIPEL